MLNYSLEFILRFAGVEVGKSKLLTYYLVIRRSFMFTV